MISALVHGTTFKSEAKTSEAGKPFIMLTLRVPNGREQTFVKAMVFGEADQEMIANLPNGSAVAVRGSLRTDVWTPPNGAPRVNVTIMADAVLPLKKNPRPAGQHQQHRQATPLKQQILMTSSAVDGDDFFGDQVPF